MSGSEDTPSPPLDLPDDLVEGVARLNDYQLAELTRYADELLAHRTRPIAAMIRETQDMDRIVSIEEADGYATVRRQDTDDGPPTLYHVGREHHPDGGVDLNWILIGRVLDE